MKLNDTLTTYIRQLFDVDVVPALMGEPGIGKSSVLDSIAYATNTKCFTVPCNVLADKADLTGGRLTKDDSTGKYQMTFYPHEKIQQAIEYAQANPRENPILNLDEINRTTSDLTSASLGLSTTREIGRETFPSNLRLAVTGNLEGNVTALDEASLSRFVLLSIEPDAEAFMAYHGDSLNNWIRKVLTQHPDLVFQKSTPDGMVVDGQSDDDDGNVQLAELFDGGEQMKQITTPRTIAAASKWLNLQVGDTTLLRELLATPVSIKDRETTALNETVEGFTGNTMFTTKLIGVIADELASNSTGQSQNAVNVPQPPCYVALKAAQSESDLVTLIADLSDNERTGSLLYALKEPDDNARLLAQLVLVTPPLQGVHMRTLTQMLTTSQINQRNVEAFLELDAPVVNATRPTMSAYVS